MTARLLETMRVEGGRVALLERHLDRLGAGAQRLGYAVDLDGARALVGLEAARRAQGGLRLTAGARGDLEADALALPARPLRTVWVDPEPVAEAGSWRCTLKTTDRAHYRARRARARERGADEAVLVNDRGAVTEGTRTNVWAEVGGRLWTPPLRAGGLGGVYRAHVLDAEARAGERPLFPDDLRTADAVYLSNALRGWMRVVIVEDG